MAPNRRKKGQIISDSDPHFSGGGVTADGFDRFELVPDCLLVSILSLLPIEDAVRTSVLSTRWRRLWTLAPLGLLDDSALRSEKFPNKKLLAFRAFHDEEQWRAQEGWRVRAIDRVLSAHAGPIRSCRLSCVYFHIPLLDGWIQTLSQKGVQDLVILIPMEKRFYLVPPSLITCQSLRSLELCYCRILKPTKPRLNLVNLRVLNLKRSLVTDAAINDLLSSCPALQSLALVHCAGLRRIHLRSPALCSMMLDDYSLEVEELFVVDAPNLEYLMLGKNATRRTHLKVLNAPKLELLGFLDMNIKMLELGSTCFEKSMVKLSTVVHSLKKLAIRVDFNDDLQADIVFDLLRCFPCLETLDVLIADMDDDDDDDDPYVDYWEQQSSFDCLDHHLKSVTLKGFLGQRADSGFVNFLIAKARVLQVITLISVHAWKEGWVGTIQQDLCLQNKASIDAEVVFMKEKHEMNQFQPWSSLF
ncbi:F-box/LRR-repeat protein At3g26922-like [Phoenix dactylifera]|uniref:F-box/LRR-repeat protein At3g26922-like n=1 Tax=Phoenix dactylifera TaxID=42345 RepID=A0A8B7CEE9_PHODC|nr:F-box/LRR-repeat protein At3g26922-like [Phoenix dactylifera]